MTTIYISRRIETVEEAEGLPETSIVINDYGDRYSFAGRRRGGWHSAADDRDLAEDLDTTFMPPKITALIPVEAEEEWGTTANGHTLLRDQLTEDEARADEGATPTRRYVTPWESLTGINKEIER